MKRKVTDLKPNEAILITNDSERDAILQLMEDAGMKWNGNQSAFRYIPDVNYDYCLTYKSDGNDGIVVLIKYNGKYGDCIVYPATDFIGSDFIGDGLTVSEPDNTISIQSSDSQIATFLRAQIDWYESNHDYQIATDTLRCWLDELEGKTEPTQLTRNTPTNEQR